MKLVPQGFYQSCPAETTSPASPVAPFRTLGARCWYHTAGWQLGAGRPKAVKQSRRKPCTWARHPPLQQFQLNLDKSPKLMKKAMVFPSFVGLVGNYSILWPSDENNFQKKQKVKPTRGHWKIGYVVHTLFQTKPKILLLANSLPSVSQYIPRCIPLTSHHYAYTYYVYIYMYVCMSHSYPAIIPLLSHDMNIPMNISRKKKKNMILGDFNAETKVHTSPKRQVIFPGMAQLDCWKKPRTWDVSHHQRSYGI